MLRYKIPWINLAGALWLTVFFAALMAIWLLLPTASALAGITPTATATQPPPTATPKPDIPQDPAPTQIIDIQFSCNLDCIPQGQSLDMRTQVRLVHQGTGWIVEGTATNLASTRFEVPYEGQWEVFVISDVTVNVGGLLLQVNPPQSIGTVWTGGNVQLLECPFLCPVEPPPYLPETGDNPDNGRLSDNAIAFGIVLASIILFVILLFLRKTPDIKNRF